MEQCVKNKTMNQLPISIGILSWGSHRTLRNTLQSYVDSGLFNVTDDWTILFQEVTEGDLAIAEEFGITKIISHDTNIGIGKAFTELTEAGKYDYSLILEVDWICTKNLDEAYKQISLGISALKNNTLDVVRYRNRFNYGDPLYTIQFKGREMDCPEHLFDCVYYLEHPELLYSYYIEKYGDWYSTTSQYASHTNNPSMYKKEFYLKNVSPYSGEGNALEGAIFNDWRKKNYGVGMMEGLFKHERLDR